MQLSMAGTEPSNMTDKKADAWMPLWIGAYLADTLHLTTLQHGAYLLLLMAYWRERSALPDDDEQLRSIAKLERSEWKRLRPVLAKFFRVGDGHWWHKRVEKEMAAAEDRSSKAAEKALKAARARWGGSPEHAASNAHSNAPSMPEAFPEALPELVLNHCPTPSPIEDISTPSVSHPPADAGGKAPRDRKASIPCPYDGIRDAYHLALPNLPRATVMSPKRRKAMLIRWNWVLASRKTDGTRRAETGEQALKWLREFFDLASENDFLMGRTRRSAEHANWKCDLDYLLTDRALHQVIEKTILEDA
jgi:uncharacterized protein YdaU (DUF1376 family)